MSRPSADPLLEGHARAPLTVSGVSFGYRPGRTVLRDLTLGFEPGRVTAVVGPNGAGKSTLLRILLGFLRPGAGSVTLGGRAVTGWSPAERARRLAYVPQRPEASFDFSVSQVVGFGRHGRAPSLEAVGRALALVELANRASEPFGTLSVGQQQRAALARAIAQLDSAEAGENPGDARYLIADEPVSAMDPRHAMIAFGLMRALARERGIGVVCVLHDLTAARELGDDAVLLDAAGRVVGFGPSVQILTAEALEGVFGVVFEEARTVDGGRSALLARARGGGTLPA